MSSKIDELFDTVAESDDLKSKESQPNNEQEKNLNPMMYIPPPNDSAKPANESDEKKNETVKTNEDNVIEHKAIAETPTFNKDERSKLENILYDYFIEKGLIKLETQIDKKILKQLGINNLNDFDFYQFLTDVMTRQSELKLLAQIPHLHDIWKSIYVDCKKNNQWTQRIKLWNLIQHQTVHLITNVYNFPMEIRNELEQCTFYSDNNPPKPACENKEAPYLNKMEIGTMNMDCIIGGIKLKKAGYNPIVLNLANQEAPAAATNQRSEGGTQEENLFKRSTLYLSLWPHRNPNISHRPVYDYFSVFGEGDDDNDNELYFNAQEIEQKVDKNKNKKNIKGFYPMDNKYGGIYSKNVYVFRGSEQSGYAMLPINQRCVLSFIAVAAQIHYGSGSNLSKQEVIAFKNKIRTIYQIALENGHDSCVLGAMGCGIFNNPPLEVAKIFHDVLINEFNGQFARVMFAILWDHNSRPQLVQSFMKYFPKNDKIFDRKK